MRQAFTLVELMIVVAIIGILASIAVPNFIEMQYKAKRAEPVVNLDGIGVAQLAYAATYDEHLKGSSNPGDPLNKKQRPWDPTMSGWDVLGYAPDGEVRCNYSTTTLSDSHANSFRASAYCDIDDDNKSVIIRYYGPKGSTTGYYNDLYTDRY